MRIDGIRLATALLDSLELPSGFDRYLAGFVAAGDAPGLSFQKAKQRAAERLGITYIIHPFPHDVTQAAAAQLIATAIADPSCGGVVIQLPLPRDLDTQALLDIVPTGKDPDVLSRASIGASPVLAPAARATELILSRAPLHLSASNVAVVGMGRLIGHPIASWLEDKVRSLHTLDIGFDEAILRDADLVILGTGSYVLDPHILKPGAGVIDFGYRRTDAGLMGDLDTSRPEDLNHLAWYTPTPGGTGPVLIAALLENFVRLASRT